MKRTTGRREDSGNERVERERGTVYEGSREVMERGTGGRKLLRKVCIVTKGPEGRRN
jgi:hypothetical protein